jgi:hypothetical protein
MSSPLVENLTDRSIELSLGIPNELEGVALKTIEAEFSSPEFPINITTTLS